MNILVFIEQRDGAIKKASLEALRTASEIASSLNSAVTAVVMGGGPASLQTLGGYGAAKTIHVKDDRLDLYSTTAYAKALTAVAVKEQADIVFLSATSMGKDLAPCLAVKKDGAEVNDITSFSVDDRTVVATHLSFAGKVFEKIKINCPKQIF